MTTPDSNPETLHNGAAWAAILAAGVGCAALGLMTDLTEASKSISNALNFYNPTGDLSGKTALAVIIWLSAWAILNLRWKDRDIGSPNKILALTLILILLALIAVFPPFFGLFAAA
jgi:hypothetical protein